MAMYCGLIRYSVTWPRVGAGALDVRYSGMIIHHWLRNDASSHNNQYMPYVHMSQQIQCIIPTYDLSFFLSWTRRLNTTVLYVCISFMRGRHIIYNVSLPFTPAETRTHTDVIIALVIDVKLSHLFINVVNPWNVGSNWNLSNYNHYVMCCRPPSPVAIYNHKYTLSTGKLAALYGFT